MQKGFKKAMAKSSKMEGYKNILVTGGFPCQDVSLIGTGHGLQSDRSGLWREFFRVICEVRPKYALVENVPGLVQRGLETIVRDLATLGYDAEWDCISAQEFGANHKRERLFILAYPQDIPGLQTDTVFVSKRSGIKAWDHPMRLRWQEMASPDWEIHETYFDGTIDGTPGRVHRSKITGNGQLVQNIQWIGERIMKFEKGNAVKVRGLQETV